MSLPETNPIYGPFFGVMGAASAIIFSCEFSSVSYSITKKHRSFAKWLSSPRSYFTRHPLSPFSFLFFHLVSTRRFVFSQKERVTLCVTRVCVVPRFYSHPKRHFLYKRNTNLPKKEPCRTVVFSTNRSLIIFQVVNDKREIPHRT